jgi:hypothetical protein
MKITTGAYLKSTELTEAGENFVITGVTEEVLPNRDGTPGDTRFILALDGAKPLVLNKINIRRLVAAFNSNESDEWISKTIQLYLDPDVEFGGEVVGGIRLRAVPVKKRRPKTPKAVPVAADETDEDAIPF